MKNLSERLHETGTGYDLAMRILDQQLLGMIEAWDVLGSVLEQELSIENEQPIIDCQKVLETAMSYLVNEAENQSLISWDDWFTIHEMVMWIGYSEEDRR